MSETSSVNGRLEDEDEDFWPAERLGASARGLLIGGAAAVVAVIVAVVVIMLRAGDEEPAGAPAGDRPVPTTYVGTGADQGTAKLGLRSADQRPLTEGEVFGDVATVSYRTYNFKLVGKAVSSDCLTATWGQRLQADLRRHGCTQLVRGAFASADGKYVAQFFAFNLDRAEGAQQIVRDLDTTVGAGFVAPLPASGTENFGGGFSAAYAEPLGHYVIMSWVQRKGGVRPDSLNEMIDASLAIGKAGDFAWQRLSLVGG